MPSDASRVNPLPAVRDGAAWLFGVGGSRAVACEAKVHRGTAFGDRFQSCQRIRFCCRQAIA